MRRMIHLILAVAVASGLLAMESPAHAQDGPTPRVEWTACPFLVPPGEVEGETITCGSLFVPQDRDHLEEGEIALAFAVLAGTGPDLTPDPIVYLEGGPGGSALARTADWVNSPLRTRRELILLDQRGMGYSTPRLYCTEMDEIDAAYEDVDLSSEDLLLIESLARHQCAARLAAEEGVDLTDYHTINNAADVADLRLALGYAEWNLLGISYGTRLALAVMRDHPAGVRSAILDSVYPPQVDAYEEDTLRAYRAFSRLFAACAADDACNTAFPFLEPRFYVLVDTLNEDPLHIRRLNWDFYGDDLIDTVFELMYDAAAIPYLPLMIHELDMRRTVTLVDLYTGTLPYRDDEWIDERAGDAVHIFVDGFFYLVDLLEDDAYDAVWDDVDALGDDDWDGLERLISLHFDLGDSAYLLDMLIQVPRDEWNRVIAGLLADTIYDTPGAFDTFECHEELPFNSFEEAAALAADLPDQIADLFLSDFEAKIEVCAEWDSGTAPPSEDEAVSSDIPALVLAGEFDPVTPPAWGRQTAANLSRSTYVEFPGGGHGAIDLGDCPLSIISAFLDAPTQPPDTTCAAALPAPVFALP